MSPGPQSAVCHAELRYFLVGEDGAKTPLEVEPGGITTRVFTGQRSWYWLQDTVERGIGLAHAGRILVTMEVSPSSPPAPHTVWVLAAHETERGVFGVVARGMLSEDEALRFISYTRTFNPHDIQTCAACRGTGIQGAV